MGGRAEPVFSMCTSCRTLQKVGECPISLLPRRKKNWMTCNTCCRTRSWHTDLVTDPLSASAFKGLPWDEDPDPGSG